MVVEVAPTVISALAVLFLFAPLTSVVLFSFHSTNALNFPLRWVLLRWYREVLSDRSVRSGRDSLLKVAAVSLTTLILGTKAAAPMGQLA
ncbi:MAG: hypothetical protein R2706_13935 [Acidimicrobiales bacterium]